MFYSRDHLQDFVVASTPKFKFQEVGEAKWELAIKTRHTFGVGSSRHLEPPKPCNGKLSEAVAIAQAVIVVKSIDSTGSIRRRRSSTSGAAAAARPTEPPPIPKKQYLNPKTPAQPAAENKTLNPKTLNP